MPSICKCSCLKENNGVVRVLSGADMNEVLVDLTGIKADDKLGRSVAMMGDIDSDGVGDILAGAPGDDPPVAPTSRAASLTIRSSTSVVSWAPANLLETW